MMYFRPVIRRNSTKRRRTSCSTRRSSINCCAFNDFNSSRITCFRKLGSHISRIITGISSTKLRSKTRFSAIHSLSNLGSYHFLRPGRSSLEPNEKYPSGALSSHSNWLHSPPKFDWSIAPSGKHRYETIDKMLNYAKESKRVKPKTGTKTPKNKKRKP